jgi:uncharacterized protein YfbU (UPF0304 family)
MTATNALTFKISVEQIEFTDFMIKVQNFGQLAKYPKLTQKKNTDLSHTDKHRKEKSCWDAQCRP